MKKFAFTIFAATLAFGANADVEPAAAANCCAYDGLFFGLGVSAVDSGVKTETTDAQHRIWEKTTDDTHGTWNPPAPGYNPIDGDIGLDTNDHDTRFTANAVLGYGKRIQEKAYVALEAGLDAGQNSDFAHTGIYTTDDKVYEVYSKNNGLIPSAALRLGYIHPETKSMFYVKAGAAYSQARTSYVDGYRELTPTDNTEPNRRDLEQVSFGYSVKCSKWTPIVALGFEKVTGKNFRTRAEVEYRFQTTKSYDFDNESERGTTDDYASGDTYANKNFSDHYKGTIKLYNKAAITLRVMGIYTVK